MSKVTKVLQEKDRQDTSIAKHRVKVVLATKALMTEITQI